MYFDTHVHIGRKDFVPSIKDDNKDKPGYVIPMDNHWKKAAALCLKEKIFKAVIFPFPFEEVKVTEANNYIAEAWKNNQDLFIPFFLISTTITEEELEAHGVRGLKEHFYLNHYKDPGYYNNAYELLQQKGLPLIIHPHMSERIDKIKYLKKEFPRLKIILAHSGRKWPFTGDDVIETILPALGKYDELYFETSTIRDPGTIEQMVRILGKERILFGSDYPFCNNWGENIYELEKEAIEKADISAQDREYIFIENFKQLFLKDYWIRAFSLRDKEALEKILAAIDKQDRKYLAIDKKQDVLRQNMRSERHIYLLEDKEGIGGFLRESGRSGNGAVVEEIYLCQRARGRGMASSLLQQVGSRFKYMEAKTFSTNKKIINLFNRMNFKVTKESSSGKILYWKSDE